MKTKIKIKNILKTIIVIQAMIVIFSTSKNIAYGYDNVENTAIVNSWESLKKEIETSTNSVKKIKIELDENENWEANSTITIKENQKISLISNDEVIIKRKANFTEGLIKNNGILTLGDNIMSGKIIFDGNKENITSNSALLKSDNGTITINNNITIQNNHSTENGGGISANNTTVNISRRNNYRQHICSMWWWNIYKFVKFINRK